GVVGWLVGTRAGHGFVGVGGAVTGLKPEPPRAARPERVNADAVANLTRVVRGVGLQVGDDLIARDMAFGIVAGVRTAGQIECPVRSHEGEAVPAATPGLGYRGALEDNVWQAGGPHPRGGATPPPG